MPLITAYISVILIWATTPLAIQWSSESVGYLFGICSRFLLGAFFALSLIIILGKKLPLESKAIQTYFAGGLGITFAMLCVYWGSQYIPSGWVSMIFGITPIMTGLFAMMLLGERGLTLFRLFAIAVSIAGLYIMLETGLQYNSATYFGIIGVLFSALFYSLSMVLVKKINADIDTYSTVTGTLLVAATLLIIIWFIFGMKIPAEIPVRTGLSIFYLAIIGSVLGFLLFYYVLKRIEAMRVSLITLITPVFALLLGHLINNEPLTWKIMISCSLILSGLLFFEFEGAIRRIRITKLLRTNHD
jgi:drug/metabolite transporter (DMT)-like permease